MSDMRQKTRDGQLIEIQDTQDKFLTLLYGNLIGRCFVKILTMPWISKLGGAVLSTGLSALAIPSFIRNNQIDMSQFEDVKYRNYNEFFMRKIKPEARVVDMDENHLISPCDCKLTVLPVEKDGRFMIKQTSYTLQSLLKDEKEAEHYLGGTLCIFRLTVDDYHRYCYIDDAEVIRKAQIPGILHTVNPIANDVYPIYKENTREYCVLFNKKLKRHLMMEVGALMVGKIVNHPTDSQVRRAQEKGHFMFGGSTVIMVFEKGAVNIDKDILENSENDIETVVRYGMKIGEIN